MDSCDYSGTEKRKKMKAKLLLLNLFCICVSCNYSQPKIINSSTIDISKIEISYVELNIETPFDVRCCDFEGFFHDEIKTATTTDSLTIDNIITALNTLQDGPDRSTPHIDTRMKIQLYSNDTLQEVICMEQYVVLRKNKLYLCSDELKNILNKIFDDTRINDNGMIKNCSIYN
jgi:hypothetical protein